MRVGLLLVGIALLDRTAFAEDAATPPGVVWQGSVAAGAELDEHGLPKAESIENEAPARWRIGFKAAWSVTLHWERIEPDPQTGDEASLKLTEDESKLIELTNAERKKMKLANLKPDPMLMKLARSHAATMARLDQIGHELEGKTFAQRMEAAKYHAQRAGENVSQGRRTPADAIAGWMQSAGHKANILQPEYTRIGVGLATSKSGKPYFVQVFAKP